MDAWHPVVGFMVGFIGGYVFTGLLLAALYLLYLDLIEGK